MPSRRSMIIKRRYPKRGERFELLAQLRIFSRFTQTVLRSFTRTLHQRTGFALRKALGLQGPHRFLRCGTAFIASIARFGMTASARRASAVNARYRYVPLLSVTSDCLFVFSGIVANRPVPRRIVRETVRKRGIDKRRLGK